LTANLLSPSWVLVIDPDSNRLKVAKDLGADHTSEPATALQTVRELTNGQGCDTVIEAVGIPETFVQCQDIVATGGVIANIGVHGSKADLHLEKLWAANICESNAAVRKTMRSRLQQLLLVWSIQRPLQLF
jgi:alcohol dehydrogenase